MTKQEKSPWAKESPFEQRKKELEAQGFTLVTQEPLTKFKFTKGARFVAIPFRTKEEIIKEYIDKYKDEVDIVVKLVDVEGLDQNQKAVYVFIKPKNKKI